MRNYVEWLILTAFIITAFITYKDLTFRMRYKDDPDTKSEWFDKGYSSGVKSGKVQGYMEAIQNKDIITMGCK